MAQACDVRWQENAAALVARLGAFALLSLLGTAAYRQFIAIRGAESHSRQRQAHRPFERRLDTPRVRVLVLGDSTGAGVGADLPCGAVAGLLAREHPDVEVVNISEPGARVADLCAQIDACGSPDKPFDLALLHIGGNDVLRSKRLADIEQQADEALARLKRIARQTVWLGPGDLGAVPLFVPPFSWWMSQRTCMAAERFERAAKRAGAEFIAFHAPCHTRVLSSDRRRYFSADGLHPSSESYAYCYGQLLQSTSIRGALSADMLNQKQVTSASTTW